jgi:hypothetical protein
VATQCAPKPGAPEGFPALELAAAATVTTVGADGRTTAAVMPAVTTAVSTTAATRPAAAVLDSPAGEGPVDDFGLARGLNRVMIDLIYLSDLDERQAYLPLASLLSGGPR